MTRRGSFKTTDRHASVAPKTKEKKTSFQVSNLRIRDLWKILLLSPLRFDNLNVYIGGFKWPRMREVRRKNTRIGEKQKGFFDDGCRIPHRRRSDEKCLHQHSCKETHQLLLARQPQFEKDENYSSLFTPNRVGYNLHLRIVFRCGSSQLCDLPIFVCKTFSFFERLVGSDFQI